jgi:hypothetical protein
MGFRWQFVAVYRHRQRTSPRIEVPRMVSFFQIHLPANQWLPKDAQEEGVGIRLGRHGRAIDGSILIGPMMTTPAEVDRIVDQLIADLEQVRRAAKQELGGH